MKISNLVPNLKNPRTVSPAKVEQLKKSMAEFGDLSGVVYNRKSKQLVAGHQRKKNFEQQDITYTKHFEKPTATGTVALGYIKFGGERFSYREVSWDRNREKAANIAANKGAGEWDMAGLSKWMRELAEFDVDIDLDLTMFDTAEIADLPSAIEVSAHTRTAGSEAEEVKEKAPPKCKSGETYRLGTIELKCGADEDLYFCDQVIAKWERYSGHTVELLPPALVRKPAKQGINRLDV